MHIHNIKQVRFNCLQILIYIRLNAEQGKQLPSCNATAWTSGAGLEIVHCHHLLTHMLFQHCCLLLA